jgi:site-specific recombinase XerD
VARTQPRLLYHGGNPAQSKIVDRFKTLLKRAKLPDIRFHDLRHSAATIFLSMGVHPEAVQELLGHNQISMTMTFTVTSCQPCRRMQ